MLNLSESPSWLWENKILCPGFLHPVNDLFPVLSLSLSSGRGVKCLFSRPPFLTFLNGAFDSIPVERTQRQLQSTSSRTLTQADQEEEAASSQGSSSEEVFRQLVHLYRRTGGAPLCYYGFIIDPDSFSRTVENALHVACLVKEDRVSERQTVMESLKMGFIPLWVKVKKKYFWIQVFLLFFWFIYKSHD